MKNIEERIEQIHIEIDMLEVQLEAKDKKWDFSVFKPYEEYAEYVRPERSAIAKLYREERMIMPYVLCELGDGDVMSLEDFIGNVKCGGFVDSDGYGRYLKDGQETNIEIYPSDVKNNSLRKEFDTIIWFNK